MLRKSTKGLPVGSKRAEMRGLEKALRKEGFKPGMWRSWGRRAMRLFVILLLLASIAWCMKWLWTNWVSTIDVFSIEQLEFKSNGVMDERQVLAIMGHEGIHSILSVDVDSLERRLRACSAIRKASVQLLLPSTLLVDVDARIPVAWIHCPGAGLRAYDPDKGMFIDADGVAFRSIADVYSGYHDVPMLQVPTPVEGEIKSGEPLDGFDTVVELISLLRKGRPGDAARARVVGMYKEWGYLVEFDDDSQALFERSDLRRQVDNYYMALAHARSSKRKIQKINLAPKRNPYIIYDREFEQIPAAIPIE